MSYKSENWKEKLEQVRNHIQLKEGSVEKSADEILNDQIEEELNTFEEDVVEVVEEEEIEDTVAAEQIEMAKEQAEDQGLDISQVEFPKPVLYNCKIKRISKTGKVKIESIPPEEFLINRTAKTIDDADFVSHKVLMTRSQIVEMGFPQDEVDSLPASSIDIYNDEKIVRTKNIDDYQMNTPTDKSTEKVLIYESYIKYDYDGDGIAELRKIISAGDDGYAVLSNEPCDNIPFVSITPIPMPHRFYGRSISELVEDIQLMKSTVMRQLLDNMYLTNNNRVAIMDGMVNMDDLLTTRPGGVVRTKQPPSQVMQPLQAQPISQQAFPLLSYLDSVREVRSGVSKQT